MCISCEEPLQGHVTALGSVESARNHEQCLPRDKRAGTYGLSYLLSVHVKAKEMNEKKIREYPRGYSSERVKKTEELLQCCSTQIGNMYFTWSFPSSSRTSPI